MLTNRWKWFVGAVSGVVSDGNGGSGLLGPEGGYEERGSDYHKDGDGSEEGRYGRADRVVDEGAQHRRLHDGH